MTERQDPRATVRDLTVQVSHERCDPFDDEPTERWIVLVGVELTVRRAKVLEPALVVGAGVDRQQAVEDAVARLRGLLEEVAK